MPAGFYSLNTKKITRETPDSVVVELEAPSFLQSQFQFAAGQYLTLCININGEEVRRSYSLCAAPHENTLKIGVKKVPGGRMSTYLNEVASEGQMIECMPPLGKFTLQKDQIGSHYFFFAGGSGITPIMSIIKDLLQNHNPENITLLYLNRNKESIMFLDEIKSLQQTYGNVLEVIHQLDHCNDDFTKNVGTPSISNLSNYLSHLPGHLKGRFQFYLCGPGPLMELFKTAAIQNNISESQINIEYFTAVEKEVNAQMAAEVDENVPLEDRHVEVEVFGKTGTVLVKANQTILEGAQEAGMDPPYSCTVGVCTTCRAKVTSGKTKMTEREGLTDDEIAQGYILTCQAHPLTEDVKLCYE
jgi:ring-1,2-phenylacetyl-CoA epoxidase subunit PaaE